MQHDGQETRVRVDGYTRVCLTAIAVLLTVLVIGLWAESGWTTDDAHAAEPFVDSSAQRRAMVDAQQQTNRKLDEIISLLQSGRVRVQIAEGAGAAAGGKDAKTREAK